MCVCVCVCVCVYAFSFGHTFIRCSVLCVQSKFEDAERNASRAVASLRKGVGSKDVSTATALYNLAGLAKRQVGMRLALCERELMCVGVYAWSPVISCPRVDSTPRLLFSLRSLMLKCVDVCAV